MHSGRLLQPSPDWTTDSTEITWRDRVKPFFIHYGSMVNATEAHFAALVNAAKQPYSPGLQAPATACTLTDPFTCQLAAGLAYYHFPVTRDEANQLMLLTEFALRAYRLQTGRYPATLQALTPRILKKVPLDPFAQGGTLVYRPTPTGYLLYSIGPDGKEDGGRAIIPRIPARPGKRAIIQHEDKGDMVAGVNQ